MTAPFRRFFVAALLIAAVFIGLAGWWASREGPAPVAEVPASGGELVATVRAEPVTFNRYVNQLFPTHVLSLLTQARLVRINRLTQQLEPALATEWRESDDRRVWTLDLRRDVVWSDGTPFTSGDVLFSFEAAYETPGSVVGDALSPGGGRIAVAAEGEHRVVLTFPKPWAPGVRVLDSLPIYPRHALEPAFRAGTFAQAWGTDTPPSAMPSLGPFILESYEPAQRIVLVRNPRYWKTDEAGTRLPYLDRLTLEIVPDQNAELLRLLSGQVDLLQSELRPEDYRTVKAEADAGRLRLVDVGPSHDRFVLWFNLARRANEADAKAFILDRRFRQAVSMAVDRRAFAESVYLGAADPAPDPLSPANAEWVAEDLPRPSFDPEGARALLDAMGLRDSDGDGIREDARGRPVRFTILFQTGVTAGEKGAQFVRDALARIGVGVDVVPLDLGAMMRQWGSGEYDAIYHYLIATDTDPAGNLDWWLSSGSSHLWAPSQEHPSDWEARIDELMLKQASSPDAAERKRLFAEVQRVFLEHNPAIYFVAPHVYVATSLRVAPVRPALQRPQLLWSAETLARAPAP